MSSFNSSLTAVELQESIYTLPNKLTYNPTDTNSDDTDNLLENSLANKSSLLSTIISINEISNFEFGFGLKDKEEYSISASPLAFLLPTSVIVKGLSQFNNNTELEYGYYDSLDTKTHSIVEAKRMGLCNSTFVVSFKAYTYDLLLKFILLFVTNHMSLIVPTDAANFLNEHSSVLEGSSFCVRLESLCTPGREIQLHYNGDPKQMLFQIISLYNFVEQYSENHIANFNCLNWSCVPSLNASFSVLSNTRNMVPRAIAPPKQWFEIISMNTKEMSFLIGKKGWKVQTIRQSTSADIRIIQNENDECFVRISSNNEDNFKNALTKIKAQLSILGHRWD